MPYTRVRAVAPCPRRAPLVGGGVFSGARHHARQGGGVNTAARNWLVGVGVLAMVTAVVAGVLLNGDFGPLLLGIRAEFYLFGLTLLGVAIFHRRTFEVALTGLAALLLLKHLTDAEVALGHHPVAQAP